MAKSGLVEFASHTNDCHIRPDAPGIERKSGEDEETYISRISADLQTSITRIELETGQNVTTFTYPLGKMELWAEPFLQQHFAVTLSGVYGTARYGDSLYHLPRYNITDLHPASEYLPRLLTGSQELRILKASISPIKREMIRREPMSNLPGKITDPHLSAEEPLTFRRCLRFILQALLLAFGCAAIIRIIGILSLFF